MAAVKDLMVKWDELARAWDDPVAVQFREEFIEPLEGEARLAVSAMETMMAAVHKARRDCQ